MSKLFKTAWFGGFRKGPVIAYLDKLNTAKREEVAAQAALNESLAARNERLEARVAQLEEELRDCERQCELGEQSGAELIGEAAQAREQAEKAGRELAIAQAACDELARELEALKRKQSAPPPDSADDAAAPPDGLPANPPAPHTPPADEIPFLLRRELAAFVRVAREELEYIVRHDETRRHEWPPSDGPDESQDTGRRAGELIVVFRRRLDEIVREFTALSRALSEADGRASRETLATIAEILDRVKRAGPKR